MIAKGEVPELLSCRVFELDLGGLLASTACKSAYEQVSGFGFDCQFGAGPYEDLRFVHFCCM